MTDEQARKRVEEEKGFYANLAAYLVVISGLAALNLLTSPEHLWFVYPMLGWGIGVASHATAVFGLSGRGRAWEERRQRELTGDTASPQRLRALVDEALDERALPTSRTAASPDELQRRIEHLEAIVTSRDWDLVDAAHGAGEAPRPRLAIPEEDAPEEDATRRAARLARRTR